MRSWKLYTVLLLCVVMAAPMLSAAGKPPANPTVVSLHAVVDGKSYGIRPAQAIPVKPKETFTLTLVGTVVDDGKTTSDVAIDATFTVNIGKGRVTLANATGNGVDVTVNEIGKHGDQLKYTVTATGYNIRAGIAEGYINLK